MVQKVADQSMNCCGINFLTGFGGWQEPGTREGQARIAAQVTEINDLCGQAVRDGIAILVASTTRHQSEGVAALKQAGFKFRRAAARPPDSGGNAIILWSKPLNGDEPREEG